MPALKQISKLSSNQMQHRAIASEIADSARHSKAAAFANSNQNQAVQRKPVIQKKPGEDDELPVQGMFINSDSNSSLPAFQPVQKKENNTGLPDDLKNGLETASGFDMNDVKVHYNSSKPAQLQAFAYAQGNDIHVGPGQEKHLPHEGWHVVQQRQGRVAPTAQMKGGPALNDDAGLEKEADQMGDAIAKGNIQQPSLFSGSFAKTNTIQQKVIQRLKKVPTNFGEFETTKFAESDGRGVDIILKFNPDPAKVDAKKIGLSQSLRKTTPGGDAYAIDPSQAARTVGTGKSGAGYATDRLSDRNNPIYGAANLTAGQGLKDTPQSNNPTAAPTDVGVNATYELGSCYKVNATDADKQKHPASLADTPQSGKDKGRSKLFETAALALDGADKDKYYGSVTWGYKMEGTDAAPTVTAMDIALASAGTPTADFIEPAKLWNAAKARGTYKVTADPSATVMKGDQSGTETLAKDAKLKQLSTLPWPGGTAPSIQAEVLKADGSGSGKIIYIKNADVADVGDGIANKPLPV